MSLAHRQRMSPSARRERQAPLAAAAAAVAVALLLIAPAPRAGAQQPAQQGAAQGGDEPIEITADRLVLAQGQQLATFYGNVDAVQGDTTLRSDELRVYYTSSEERQASGSDQSVRRLEAEGNVVITQPGETASGRSGVYDVLSRKMMLEGDVVLTRGQNVVRGDRLDVDLETSVSTVSSAPASGEQRDQRRVRALFVPEQNQAGQ
jgi:lipopolysaccharide export system protein LptA